MRFIPKMILKLQWAWNKQHADPFTQSVMRDYELQSAERSNKTQLEEAQRLVMLASEEPMKTPKQYPEVALTLPRLTWQEQYTLRALIEAVRPLTRAELGLASDVPAGAVPKIIIMLQRFGFPIESKVWLGDTAQRYIMKRVL